MLRELLRLLPCRPSERAKFRSVVIDVVRHLPAPPAAAAADQALATETLFLLRAQQHLKELNERYFPTSGMSEKEVIAATAARVGFRMPKQVEGAPPPPPSSKDSA